MSFGSLRGSARKYHYISCSYFSTARSASTSLTSATSDPSVSLDFHRDASLAVLTLCNSQHRNALTYSMMHQLDTHVKTIHEWSNSTENNARVLILTGSGGTFCAGLDIRQNNDNDTPLQDGRKMAEHMSRLTNCIHSLPVLSVAAVDGNAIGGGAELSTCTDLVVLSRQSTIKFVHASRGASPGWGGGRRLVHRVGRRKALQMLLLGKSVHGNEEAEQLDYADYVAEIGESAFEAATRLVVDPILDLPCSQSVKAIKRVVSVADGDDNIIDLSSGRLRYQTLDNHRDVVKAEVDAFMQVWGSENNRELIQLAKDSLNDKKKS